MKASDRPVAVVTGASRGIGAATAIAFAQRGHDVALAARSADDLHTVAGHVRDAGGEALVLPVDLADVAAGERVIDDAVARFGRIDALVNNAAWRELVTLRTIGVESWEKTLRICVTTPMFMARRAATHMEQRGRGVIINVSSVQSQRASGIAPAYIAAKGALDAMAYELAALFGPSGVRAVTINPGAIDTDMSGDYVSDQGVNLSEKLRADSEDAIPLRRWGQPDEIARVICWLASDEASYITGTTLVIDGGLTHHYGRYSFKRLQFPDQF